MSPGGGAGFQFEPSPGTATEAAPGTTTSRNQSLEAAISTLLGMSREQIDDLTASQGLDPDTGAGDEPDDDPDGFDPDSDSDADDERDADEFFQDDRSEWESLEVPPRVGHREADIVLRPGDTQDAWIAVLARPTAAPGLRVPPLMRRALEGRDRTILAVAQAIVDRQEKYLTTCQPSDLESLTQDTVARLAHLTKGRVSRTIEKNTLQLPDGQIVPLEALVVDSDFTRARLVRDVFVEWDRVERVEGVAVGVDNLAPWEDVYQVARQRTVGQDSKGQKGSSEQNFRRAARRFGLPVNVKVRRKAYLEGTDWWTASF